MKKKMIAVLTAAMVLSMGTFAVFAESPTVETAEAPVASQKAATSVADTKAPEEYATATTVSEGYSVEAVSQTTVDAAKVAVQNEVLKDINAIGTLLGNNTLSTAATDSSKKVTATILSVVDVKDTSAVQKDGKYEVTLKNAQIAADDACVILHYTGSAWEVIKPTSVAAGSVTFTTSSLSPFAVVKLETAGAAQSPKTGASLPLAGAVLVISLAGAALCGKKYFA